MNSLFDLYGRARPMTCSSEIGNDAKGLTIMSLLQDVPPEELAKLVHHYQEALAGDFDCAANKESLAPWERTPQNERKLRIAAVRMALLELEATLPLDGANRKHYAKPGEAEWGC